jgi:hypothetical protein
VVGERGEDPDVSVVGLVEVSTPEGVAVEEVDDIAVDDRANGLDEVKSEGIAGADVGVDDAQPGVKTDGETGEPAFDLGERVEVVEKRIAGS